MSEIPVVSVIINCYDGEKYLKNAIDSVLSQTFTRWEIVFWDNQSTDSSGEIFKSYNDPRFRYFYAPEHTLLYEARNYAIEKARGEFIAFLDVDDWWDKTKLERQVSLFKDESVAAVFSNYYVVNENKNKIWKASRDQFPTGNILDELLRNYFVALLTLVVRKSVFNGDFYVCNPDYHIIGDFDLVVRLASKWKLDCVQEPLAYYRIHGSNETSLRQDRQIEELDLWINRMRDVSGIGDIDGFEYVSAHKDYITAINYIFKRERQKALSVLNKMRWTKYKLRLLIAVILPSSVLRKLKN